jgi:hypothetical protein
VWAERRIAECFACGTYIAQWALSGTDRAGSQSPVIQAAASHWKVCKVAPTWRTDPLPSEVNLNHRQFSSYLTVNTHNRYYKDQPIYVVYRNNGRSGNIYEAHTFSGNNANHITVTSSDTACN